MTHSIQRQGMDNDLITIFASIKYIIRGIGSCLNYLNYPLDKLKEELEVVEQLQYKFDAL